MVIYLITNDETGKQYVGQTRLSLEERIEWYKISVRYHKNGRYPIVSAMRKHGLESFDFETLRECSSFKELDFWERHYIRKLGTRIPKGYNAQSGGRSFYVPQEWARKALREKLVLKRYYSLEKEKATVQIDRFDEEVDDFMKAVAEMQ